MSIFSSSEKVISHLHWKTLAKFSRVKFWMPEFEYNMCTNKGKPLDCITTFKKMKWSWETSEIEMNLQNIK